jgi:hypothetical protein
MRFQWITCFAKTHAIPHSLFARHYSASLVRALGSQHRRQTTALSSTLRCLERLSSVEREPRRLKRTASARAAVKCWTGGQTTQKSARVEATGRLATTLSGTWSTTKQSRAVAGQNERSPACSTSRHNVDGIEDALDGHGRRPADVWLPRGSDGTCEALDITATSGMQVGLFRDAPRSPELVFERYERFKWERLATDRACRIAGFRFSLMTIEAHGGGWNPSARRTLDWITAQVAAASDESRSEVTPRIAHRIARSP